MRSMRLTVLSLGLAAVLVGCGAASAGSSGGSAEDSAQAEGIAVHGNWKIAILDPDGTVDREYEFRNAFKDAGADALGALLGIDSPTAPSTIQWSVVFGETDILNPGGDPVAGVGPCSFDLDLLLSVQDRNALLGTGCFLSSPLAASDPGTARLTAMPMDGGVSLSGTVEATQAGSINYVETWLVVGELSTTIIPAAFTGTGVGPFEDIVAGQSIQVTVEITFSSPSA